MNQYEIEEQLLRTAAKMYIRGDVSIEEYLETCAHIFAEESGERVEEIEIRVRLVERAPAN